MRSPQTVLETLRKHAQKAHYQYERLYRNLYNPQLYLLAYQNLYANKGSTTAGADGATGEILGVHLYGQHVTDMIGEVSAAMTAEATAEELIGSIHPHPTVNEALGEAFMAAWNGKAINSL